MQRARTASLLTRCSPLHMPSFLYVFEITLFDLGAWRVPPPHCTVRYA